MAKPDKAQITYMVGEAESVLRFHSVIAEEHEVTTEITKFPVQSGFNISNHAIKKNRVVTITGAVSNHLIVGAEEFHQYGGNNVKLMFGVLKDLVRQAIPCEVQTNYGKYSTVIFTKFKTKMVAGKTDMMEFTMRGEEIQLATTVNGNKPTLLVFTPVAAESRAARVDEMAEAGIEVPDNAVLSESSVDMNGSFQVESVDSAGNKSVTTYDKIVTDPTTGLVNHLVHTTSSIPCSIGGGTFINWFAIMQEEGAIMALEEAGEVSVLPNADLSAGLSTASACLSDGLVGLATDLVEETVCTALGKLKQSAYGAVYGATGVNGNRSAGQVLLGLGVDCLVAGAVSGTTGVSMSDDFQDNNIPTVDQVLGGASVLGDALTTDVLGVAAPTTLTKISAPTEDVTFFGDLL